MKSIIFMFFGAVMVAAGLLVYIVIGAVLNSEAVGEAPVDLDLLRNGLQYGVGGLLAGIGAVMILCGLAGLARRSRQGKQDHRILQNGAETEGTVTFVDKNYSLLVNNRPIYSIVEYTYKDGTGQEHTNRIDTLNSEQVIRSQIQVGSRIPVKYDHTDPGTSVVVM